MKKIILLGAATTALGLSVPAYGQDPGEGHVQTSAEQSVNELDAFTKIFENMFEKDDSPIDPALLSKGERIAGAVVPKGSYRKIMAETFSKVVDPMMASIDEMPLSTIAGFAGVRDDDIKLKEGAKLSDLMAMIDPYFKQRNQMMMTKITEIMIDLPDDIEPSIRAGMSKAYARRFSADELEAAAACSMKQNPARKFAGESLAILYQPRSHGRINGNDAAIHGAVHGGDGRNVTNGNGDIPPPRSFSDLTDEEKDKLSELMGIDRDSRWVRPVSNL